MSWANSQVERFFNSDDLYGAWLDPRGNEVLVHAVDDHHYGVARKLLGVNKRNHHPKRKYAGMEHCKSSQLLRYSTYAVLFRFGWVRIVFNCNTLCIEHSAKKRLTRKQRDTIDILKSLHEEFSSDTYCRRPYITGRSYDVSR